MHKIVMHYQVLMKKGYFFVDHQTMFLMGDIPKEELDYQVFLDDELIKDYDNPLLDETNTFEHIITLLVDDTKYKNIITSIVKGRYEIDETDVLVNDLNLLVIKHNIAVYYSYGQFYMVKNDFTPFTEDDVLQMEDTWDCFLMWYIEVYGPIAADSRKIIAYVNDDRTIIKIISDLKIFIKDFKNDYGNIFKRIPS